MSHGWFEVSVLGEMHFPNHQYMTTISPIVVYFVPSELDYCSVHHCGTNNHFVNCLQRQIPNQGCHNIIYIKVKGQNKVLFSTQKITVTE